MALTSQITQLKKQHRQEVQALRTALEQAHGENPTLRRELTHEAGPGSRPHRRAPLTGDGPTANKDPCGKAPKSPKGFCSLPPPPDSEQVDPPVIAAKTPPGELDLALTFSQRLSRDQTLSLAPERMRRGR